MGPADQVTSHMYSFGFRGKQFQYVAGQLPAGVKFHGRLTDHDVRKIQDAGGRVEVIDAHYTEQELELARKSCGLLRSTAPSSGGSSKSEPDSKETQTYPSAPAVTAPAAQAASQSAPIARPPELSTVVIKSEPDGADVKVDGKFVGSTPSTVKLAPGDHTISIEKSGFKTWQRIVTVSSSGNVTVDATLEKVF